jgi:hypothetical protein
MAQRALGHVHARARFDGFARVAVIGESVLCQTSFRAGQKHYEGSDGNEDCPVEKAHIVRGVKGDVGA